MKTGELTINAAGGMVLDVRSWRESRKVKLKDLAESFQEEAKKLKAAKQEWRLAVEFDEEGGKPVNIRKGAVQPEAAEPKRHDKPSRGRRRGGGGARQAGASKQQGGRQRSGGGKAPAQGRRSDFKREFHNPYNFVPAPKRNRKHSELGDAAPAGHHRYHEDRWSGTITVRLKAKTPVLVPDAGRLKRDDGDHKTFRTRVGQDGKPAIPPTSIKGMLSAAYEAVTNSRFRIFTGHDDRLAFRMDAHDGLAMVPARIVGDEIELLMGTTNGMPTWGTDNRWHLNNDLMYAAWLPRYFYRGGIDSKNAVRYADGSLPEHGEEVYVWCQKVEHKRWNHHRRQYKVAYRYWRVVKVARSAADLGTQPSPLPSATPPDRDRPYHDPVPVMQDFRGFVCVTNQNIKRKHDERVFLINRGPGAVRYPVSLLNGKGEWKTLIRDYQAKHKRAEVWDRTDNFGNSMLPEDAGAPNRNTNPPKEFIPAHSRQVYLDGTQPQVVLPDGTTRSTRDVATLKPDDLCYVRFDRNGKPQGLYPVMISRQLHESAPAQLLEKSQHPAASIEELSPADRVFGWVRQDASRHAPKEEKRKPKVTAYRGQLRVKHVVCRSAKDDALQDLGADGLPLAILGEPKPEQFRFYTGTKDGQPIASFGNDAGKDKGYTPERSINRRKVYPHHAGPPSDNNAYWERPEDFSNLDAPGDEGWFREFARCKERNRPDRDLRGNQNRSMQDWIKPRAEFTFDIEVTNLSKVELGALLWLLTLNDGGESEGSEVEPLRFHRLGGGKPLGFGSVALSVDSLDLRNGEAIRSDYRTLAGRGAEGRRLASTADVGDVVESYQSAVAEAYGTADENTEDSAILAAFEAVDFIKAFRTACQGFGDATKRLPVHYPRIDRRPQAEGKNYEWFMDNEKQGRDKKGFRLPLPLLGGPDSGLPLNPND